MAAALAVVVAIGIAAPASAEDPPREPLPAEQTLGALAAVAPCDPNGANSRDTELASRLNSVLTKDMRGYMYA